MNGAQAMANPGIGGDWRAGLQPSHRTKLVQKLVEALIDCVSPADQQERAQPIRDLATSIEVL